jgi:hypothetical protein
MTFYVIMHVVVDPLDRSTMHSKYIVTKILFYFEIKIPKGKQYMFQSNKQ